ncbi:MAG: single-stranded DNA-binding protein [Actinobacteria bacterium]|nr:single-stranded DNA-binding protein [Actinomycetota bacterium]
MVLSANEHEERAVNIVVLQGKLGRAPEHRELPSGAVVTTLEVTTTRPGSPAETVPVAWHGKPLPAAVALGAPVLVTGRVRRRFFRAGGATQSRTEVVADAVVPAGQRRKLARALAAALEAAGAPAHEEPRRAQRRESSDARWSGPSKS